jgi:NAD(P)-dependent dehydrogenase (short-subunit alcohol dehydrogenase family)
MTKRILIVGGNTGIGAALNEQLLAEGFETILISRNQGGVDVLDDERFTSLQSFSTPLEEKEVGRDNPFSEVGTNPAN